MVRIFFIHGVNSRSELSHMFAGARVGADDDGIKREYDAKMLVIEEKAKAAAIGAGFEAAEFVPVYWGDLGGRLRHYRVERDDDGKETFEAQVQTTVDQSKIAWSTTRERVQGSGWTRNEVDERILFELEAIAARMDAPAPSLRDVVLAEPHAALAALFAEEPEARGSKLADRIAHEHTLRTSLQAIDATAPDADQHLIARLADELAEAGGERRQGARRGPMRFVVAAASMAMIPLVKSSKAYAHASRMMGDALIYFLQRGTRERPGPIIERVGEKLRKKLPREPDGVPTVVITHSLGCTIFYDLFTHFDPELRFDLWVSVGSQLTMYEEIKILANSRPDEPLPETPGRPRPTRVALPPGALWYNVFDHRDPLGYASEGVFQPVTDVMRRCQNGQLDEIHNAHLEEDALYVELKKWLEPLRASRRSP